MLIGVVFVHVLNKLPILYGHKEQGLLLQFRGNGEVIPPNCDSTWTCPAVYIR